MKWIELGEILTVVKGKKPENQSSEQKVGYLPYVNIETFETGKISHFTDGRKCVPCEKGDILIVCDGARSGLVGRAFKGYVGSTLAKLTANGFEEKFLFYFLQSKFTLLNTRIKGSGTPHLNIELLKQQKIMFLDRKEQLRIVERIEKLFSGIDAGIESLQKIRLQLATYRQVVLKEAFENIEKKQMIREISQIVTSGSRGWAKYYSNEGARFIRITDLTRDGILLKNDNIQYVKVPEKVEGKRSRLQKNDVLVSITADLGSIALVPESIEEAYINQHIAMIRFDNAALGEFMAWYLKSDYGQKDLLKNKRGGGKLGLGLDDIRKICVPVASNEFAEKVVQEINSKMSVCENTEQAIGTALQQSDTMRQSILKNIFEGRVSA